MSDVEEMFLGISYPLETEDWSLVCDMGEFDLVVLQSDEKPLMEAGKTMFQPMFERNLNVIPSDEIRKLTVWETSMLMPAFPFREEIS